MGYRSQVYIAVPKKAEKKMDRTMSKYNLLSQLKVPKSDFAFKKEEYKHKWLTYDDEDSNLTKKHTKDYIIYKADFLKWYEGYKDVDDVNKVVEKYEDDGACMFCVGEDEEVHSTIGDYHEIFDVYTEVKY
jgi:hypothetical protein